MVAVMAAALAGGSSAEQLNIGLRTVTGYSSNVFGRVDDTVSGSIYSLAGDFELEADRRVWSYDLQYSPRVNGRGDENERVALAHRATLRGRFSPTQRIQVKGSSRVIHEQDFRFDLEEEGLDPGEIATNDARQVTRLWNDVSVTRRMSPRLSLTGGARVTVAEFEDEDRSDNLGFSGNASASYVWSDRLNLGLGGSVQYRSFEDRQSNAIDDGRRSTTYQGFLSAGYQVTPSLRISAQAGPAYLTQTREDNREAQLQLQGLVLGQNRFPSGVVGGQRVFVDRAGCTVFPAFGLPTCTLGAGSEVTVPDSEFLSRGFGTAEEAATVSSALPFDDETGSFTFFASVEVTQRLRQGSLGLGYTRSEQPTLGNSSTSIFDEVRVYASLPLSARWRVFLNGSWVRSQLQQFIIQPQNSYPQLGITGTSPNNGAGREILVIQRVDSEQRLRQDLMVWRMATSLEHRLTRRLRLTGRFEYRRRDTDIDSLVGDTRERGFDDYRGVLTIRYTWDPIRL